jgi:alpha-galactosidase
VYVEFTRNYYFILEELRRKHPGVEIESCSGGGGRVDLGVLRFADEVWTSDNTDAFDRLQIQNGFTYAYAPAVMVAWVTDSPTWVNHRNLSISYRFLSSMQGALGIGADLSKWDEKNLAAAGRLITEYKTIRETVQRGGLYRLLGSEEPSNAVVNQYVSRNGDQAVVFAFLHSSQERYPFPRVVLRGLEPAVTYSMEALEGQLAPGTPAQASGAYWMQQGMNVLLEGDFQAAAIVLHRVAAASTAELGAAAHNHRSLGH